MACSCRPLDTGTQITNWKHTGGNSIVDKVGELNHLSFTGNTIKTSEIDFTAATLQKFNNSVSDTSHNICAQYSVVDVTHNNIVGQMLLIGDSLGHMVTEILTTSATLNNGVINWNEHSDTVVNTYIRRNHVKEGGNSSIAVGSWSTWTYYSGEGQFNDFKILVAKELNKKINTSDVVQQTGDSTTSVMSQKAVSHELATKADAEQVNNSLYNLEKKIGDRVVVEGNVINLPDEEDLTYVEESERNVIKLADRVYTPENFSGKGYKILRKNINEFNLPTVDIVVNNAPTSAGDITITINSKQTTISLDSATDTTTAIVANKIATTLKSSLDDYDVSVSSNTIVLIRNNSKSVSPSSIDVGNTAVGISVKDSITENVRKNVLIKDMINKPNTVYEIRYDFDLNGETIEIPDNCTLRFIGGKLANGTLKGTYSNIVADNVGIFGETLSLAGNFNGKGVLEYYEKNGFWDTAFKNILLTFAYVELASMKTYTFSGNIIDTRAKKSRFRIEGNHAKVLNLTFLYNIDKNGTNVAGTSAIGSQLPSILNINFFRNDGKALPAIISGSALSIENCTFRGFTYCIAFLPIYIDTFVIDKGQTWACDYLLTSMNANGELTDSYFIGDWFSTKNFGFYGKGFTSFPITRGNFLFENCLHVILSLGYSGDFTPSSFSATFIRCHFEHKSPMITYKKTDWNIGSRITFIDCWFYSSSLSDYPNQYHINSNINVGNNSNTNKVDLGTIIGTYCINYKAAGVIVNDSSLVNRDTTKLLPIRDLSYISIDTRALYIANENIFHAGDTVKISIGYSSSPNALILNNNTSQLFQKDFTCPKDGLIVVTIWPKSRSFYLHCFYTFEGKTYRSVVPVSNYAFNGGVNDSVFNIRFSKDKCLGSFFHEYSGELKYEVDTSGIIKGGTSSRPTLTSDNAGYEYYDIDLGKKILWNGTAWVNLDGTALE